jgi:hypothetical protein
MPMSHAEPQEQPLTWERAKELYGAGALIHAIASSRRSKGDILQLLAETIDDDEPVVPKAVRSELQNSEKVLFDRMSLRDFATYIGENMVDYHPRIVKHIFSKDQYSSMAEVYTQHIQENITNHITKDKDVSNTINLDRFMKYVCGIDYETSTFFQNATESEQERHECFYYKSIHRRGKSITKEEFNSLFNRPFKLKLFTSKKRQGKTRCKKHIIYSLRNKPLLLADLETIRGYELTVYNNRIIQSILKELQKWLKENNNYSDKISGTLRNELEALIITSEYQNGWDFELPYTCDEYKVESAKKNLNGVMSSIKSLSTIIANTSLSGGWLFIDIRDFEENEYSSMAIESIKQLVVHETINADFSNMHIGVMMFVDPDIWDKMRPQTETVEVFEIKWRPEFLFDMLNLRIATSKKYIAKGQSLGGDRSQEHISSKGPAMHLFDFFQPIPKAGLQPEEFQNIEKQKLNRLFKLFALADESPANAIKLFEALVEAHCDHYNSQTIPASNGKIPWEFLEAKITEWKSRGRPWDPPPNPEPLVNTPPRSGPRSELPLSTLRQVLADCFNDIQLNSFLFDYYPDVYKENQGQSFPARILALLEYCEREGTVPELIQQLWQQRRPCFENVLAKQST